MSDSKGAAPATPTSTDGPKEVMRSESRDGFPIRMTTGAAHLTNADTFVDMAAAWMRDDRALTLTNHQKVAVSHFARALDAELIAGAAPATEEERCRDAGYEASAPAGESVSREATEAQWYPITVEYAEQMFVARAPDFAGLVGCDAHEAQAVAELREAITMALDVMREDGDAIPAASAPAGEEPATDE